MELGPEVKNHTVVERGIEAGEQIVVEGYHKLSHGMKVAPVQDDVVIAEEQSEVVVDENLGA